MSFFEFGQRVINTVPLQIDGRVLPKIDELEATAKIVRIAVEPFLADAGNQQNHTAHGVGAVSAIVKEGAPSRPAVFGYVHPVGAQQGQGQGKGNSKSLQGM